MKTGHCEGGIARDAAVAAVLRDEPTHREPATFHRDFDRQGMVTPKDRPGTGRTSGDDRALRPAGCGFKTSHFDPRV